MAVIIASSVGLGINNMSADVKQFFSYLTTEANAEQLGGYLEALATWVQKAAVNDSGLWLTKSKIPEDLATAEFELGRCGINPVISKQGRAEYLDAEFVTHLTLINKETKEVHFILFYN